MSKEAASELSFGLFLSVCVATCGFGPNCTNCKPRAQRPCADDGTETATDDERSSEEVGP
jgi:hypothetical protein